MKYRITRQGICKEVSLPCYGRQDVGISPGGAMDSFALVSGNRLLGNPDDAPALEIIYPPEIVIEEEGCFILTGGALRDVILKDKDTDTKVEHAVVYRAGKGARLSFGTRAYGFRTYLCFILASDAASGIEGIQRGTFKDIAPWTDPEGLIRVLEGPEYEYFDNAADFLNRPWTVSRDISDMGMRLENQDIRFSSTMEGNMISEAVADGTIQMTPKGPIILLKHRQTVGGYPRMLNVISADVDLLAQYGPGQILRFKKTSLPEARKILIQKNKDLDRLRRK
ncbi:MAG: hypothetical protein PQJ58_19555 [Spirochaetales bacterium]|nr:hypothetical protein [Spirochaetales bacterium]